MASNSEKEPQFTDPMECGHCGNVAPMRKRATYSTIGPVKHERLGFLDEGYEYEIIECPSCKKISLISAYYFELIHDEQEPDTEILYPTEDRFPAGLPEAIKTAYRAAVRVKHVDANAYGVLARRVLEMVCEDREAHGDNLNAKLDNLASRDEIPANLVGVARGLRNLGNVGAHPVLGELTAKEVPVLSDLLRAILEYVYSAPHLARLAERSFDKLKKKPKK